MKRYITFQLCILIVLAGSLLSGGLPVSTAHADRQFFQTNGKRRALLIGIGEYRDPRFPRLEYPMNDVARLAELLESPNYGFNVTKLTDETPDKPTRANILKAIRKHLIEDAREGDTVFFYYSGHGSSILNSLSDELDKRDETIVPADAVRPVKNASQLADIRDKELAELFNSALDKKINLTAIFDSCHSGSVARGEERTKEVDGVEFDIRTAPTPTQTVKPETRGALILTAAEDYQKASGGTYELNGRLAKYSHFTAELLQSLYEDPADGVTARDLYRQITARLVAAGRSQTPTIAGVNARMEQTIFAREVKEISGRARVPLTIKVDNGASRMMLGGGIADGLVDGVVLRRIDLATGRDTTPAVKVRIRRAGLSLSEFDVVESGVPASILKDGDFFEQTTWVTKREPDLTVWVPPGVSSVDNLKKVAAALSDEKKINSIEVVGEPAPDQPINLMFSEVVNGKPEWHIELATGVTAPLGPMPTAEEVARVLTARNRKLFVNLPPTAELRSALEAAITKGDSGIVLSKDRHSANYELAGRVNPTDGSLEYAWILGTVLEAANIPASGKSTGVQVSLPAVTDWANSATATQAASELKTTALKLGRIRGWLKLSSPVAIGSHEFPYRLEIRERGADSAGPLKAGDPIFADRDYDLVLSARPASLKNNFKMMPEFWVYVMNIDSSGNGSYLATGVNEKYGGMTRFDILNPAPEIPLTHKNGLPLKVFPPFGTETFILLVTDRPIDKNALSFYGVRGQQAATRGEFSPLTKLLDSVGAETRAKGSISTPDTWAVQQLVLRSKEKSQHLGSTL